MKTVHKTKNVVLPQATFQKMIGAMSAVEEAKEHIEDFLMLSDKKMIAGLRSARIDHAKGKIGSWQTLKARYGVSSHSNGNI